MKKWKTVLNNWHKGKVLKYPKKMKKAFMWRTSRLDKEGINNYKEEYISFYKKLSQGIDTTFNFPLQTFPISSPVYVLKYSEDSLLAKVVSYYKRKNMSGQYTKGWVYAETLHINPPNEK